MLDCLVKELKLLYLIILFVSVVQLHKLIPEELFKFLCVQAVTNYQKIFYLFNIFFKLHPKLMRIITGEITLYKLNQRHYQKLPCNVIFISLPNVAKFNFLHIVFFNQIFFYTLPGYSIYGIIMKHSFHQINR